MAMARHEPPAGRKADHLRIAAGPGVEHAAGTGLEGVRLRHRALPGRDLADVGLDCDLLGVRLAAPLVISAMTGGTADALEVNRRLARAAAELGVAQVRGADGPERAERLLDVLGADGLSIHLNPVQEAVQPEGQPAFSGVLEGIAAVVARLAPRPVVVKEVGFGMDPEDVRALAGAGVAAVDVAGAGGTNWALIEGRRDAGAASVASAFAGWGIPTAESLRCAKQAAPDLPAIASGGLRDGVEIAKCLALGAVACGLARPLLIAAQADHVDTAIVALLRQLRIATWAAGAPAAESLGEGHLQ